MQRRTSILNRVAVPHAYLHILLFLPAGWMIPSQRHITPTPAIGNLHRLSSWWGQNQPALKFINQLKLGCSVPQTNRGFPDLTQRHQQRNCSGPAPIDRSCGLYEQSIFCFTDSPDKSAQRLTSPISPQTFIPALLDACCPPEAFPQLLAPVASPTGSPQLGPVSTGLPHADVPLSTVTGAGGGSPQPFKTNPSY